MASLRSNVERKGKSRILSWKKGLSATIFLILFGIIAFSKPAFAINDNVKPISEKNTSSDSLVLKPDFIENEAKSKIKGLEENKTIFLSVESAEKRAIEKISFKNKKKIDEGSIKIKDLKKKRPKEIVSSAEKEIYSYFQIELNNISNSEIEQTKIQFKVNKSWLKERKSKVSNIFLYKYKRGNWKRVPTKLVKETKKDYLFKAESKGFSYFSIGIKPERTIQLPNIKAKNLLVNYKRNDKSFNVNIRSKFKNFGESEGEKDVKIYYDGNSIYSEVIRLGKKEETEISYNFSPKKAGIHQLQIGQKQKEITIKKEDLKREIKQEKRNWAISWLLNNPITALSSLAILTAIAGLGYFWPVVLKEFEEGEEWVYHLTVESRQKKEKKQKREDEKMEKRKIENIRNKEEENNVKKDLNQAKKANSKGNIKKTAKKVQKKVKQTGSSLDKMELNKLKEDIEELDPENEEEANRIKSRLDKIKGRLSKQSKRKGNETKVNVDSINDLEERYKELKGPIKSSKSSLDKIELNKLIKDIKDVSLEDNEQVKDILNRLKKLENKYNKEKQN